MDLDGINGCRVVKLGGDPHSTIGRVARWLHASALRRGLKIDGIVYPARIYDCDGRYAFSGYYDDEGELLIVYGPKDNTNDDIDRALYALRGGHGTPDDRLAAYVAWICEFLQIDPKEVHVPEGGRLLIGRLNFGNVAARLCRDAMQAHPNPWFDGSNDGAEAV